MDSKGVRGQQIINLWYQKLLYLEKKKEQHLHLDTTGFSRDQLFLYKELYDDLCRKVKEYTQLIDYLREVEDEQSESI